MADYEKVIDEFYTAFSQKDAETMASLYHDDASFSDPVFPELDAAGVSDMWRMLCESEDLKIEFSEIQVDGQKGSARWDAWYSFPKVGRRQVHNIIHATFTFKDGKILTHEDDFDFWRWSKMALGVPGYLFGWSGLLKNAVRKTAAKQLKRWVARQHLMGIHACENCQPESIET